MRCQIFFCFFCFVLEKQLNDDSIYIHVSQSERTFQVLYRKSHTVAELKTQIHCQEGVKESNLKLSFRTSPLNDNDTLESYGE